MYLEDDLNTFRIFRGFSQDNEEKNEWPSGLTSPTEKGGPVKETPEETLAEGKIDLEALSKKVYVLFRQELRLERERLVRRKSW